MGTQKRVILEIKNLKKTFTSKNSERLVVNDVSFEVRENEFLVLLGPGYCGKTVILNMLMGLLQPDSGEILFNGQKLTPETSGDKFGMVFQKLGLMPWKTVMQNVEFAAKLKGVAKEERQKIAQYYIDLVGLTGFENHYPHQLSGGMKQRVGIARAYTTKPEIMIMDEPFGQLDAQTRYAMQEEVIRVWEKEKRTIIFVTNNIEEATYLADRIILFSKCPAHTQAIYEVEIPRPRNMTDMEFLKMRKMVSDNTDLAL